MSQNVKELTSNITRLQLTDVQAAIIDYIWDNIAAQVKEADDRRVVQSSLDMLYKSLF